MLISCWCQWLWSRYAIASPHWWSQVHSFCAAWFWTQRFGLTHVWQILSSRKWIERWPDQPWIYNPTQVREVSWMITSQQSVRVDGNVLPREKLVCSMSSDSGGTVPCLTPMPRYTLYISIMVCSLSCSWVNSKYYSSRYLKIDRIRWEPEIERKDWIQRFMGLWIVAMENAHDVIWATQNAQAFQLSLEMSMSSKPPTHLGRMGLCRLWLWFKWAVVDRSNWWGSEVNFPQNISRKCPLVRRTSSSRPTMHLCKLELCDIEELVLSSEEPCWIAKNLVSPPEWSSYLFC